MRLNKIIFCKKKFITKKTAALNIDKKIIIIQLYLILKIRTVLFLLLVPRIRILIESFIYRKNTFFIYFEISKNDWCMF